MCASVKEGIFNSVQIKIISLPSKWLNKKCFNELDIKGRNLIISLLHEQTFPWEIIIEHTWNLNKIEIKIEHERNRNWTSEKWKWI